MQRTLSEKNHLHAYDTDFSSVLITTSNYTENVSESQRKYSIVYMGIAPLF